MLDLENLPPVPEHARPKRLPVNKTPADDLKLTLEQRGWEIHDVRTMSGADAVKATLEGIRLGSIDSVNLRELELEAKIYGLLKGEEKEKPQEKKQEMSKKDTLKMLLDFQNPKYGGKPLFVDKIPQVESQDTVYKPPPTVQSVKPQKKAGRPFGAKDSAPRLKLTGIVKKNKIAKLRALGRHAEADFLENDGNPPKL